MERLNSTGMTPRQIEKLPAILKPLYTDPPKQFTKEEIAFMDVLYENYSRLIKMSEQEFSMEFEKLYEIAFASSQETQGRALSQSEESSQSKVSPQADEGPPLL